MRTQNLFFLFRKILYLLKLNLISNFFLNLILLTLSFLTIIKCKVLKIRICNYLVSYGFNNGKIDDRSYTFIKKADLKNSLNIVRSISFINSIIFYIKNHNIIFYFSINYFIKIFTFIKINKTDNYYVKKRRFYTNLFKFLSIKRFISIDDYRIIDFFLDICEQLNIKSIGYTHGFYSKLNMSKFHKQFDILITWSKYFKNLFIKTYNQKYGKKNLKTIFFIYTKKKYIFNRPIKNHIDILFPLDENYNLKKLTKLILQLNSNNYIVAVKFKPSSNKHNYFWLKFLIKNKIKFFKSENFNQITNKFSIRYLAASNTSALYESCLFGAIPILIKNKSDFSNHVIKEKIIKVTNYNFNEISSILDKNIDPNELKFLKNFFWDLPNKKRIDIRRLLYG